ncbi:alpha/beta hydrolase [Paenibacillus sp. NPDC056579]|uniref:alpha/beta hydrolase n=1 Tax=Paenibacillus sp. NPDC056579 TaxID=3345871 RepID=UPI0036CFA90A
MALIHVEFYSEVLALSSSMDVIVPQQLQKQPERFKPPYPVLYLLHGGSDNHTNWQRNTAIERYVANLGLVVVMPAVQYSFYSDQKYGLNYFTFLSEELPRLVKQFFHVSDRREDTFAAGLSMGGYGAFKLGIVCPDRYAAVASMSGSLDQRSRLTGEPSLPNSVMLQMAKHTFGSVEEYEHSANDLAYVLETHLANGKQLPKMYQACGTLDHNYEINKRFYSQFQNRLDLTYTEAPNRGHEWNYWDETIQQVLEWLPIRGK